ncbi:MAG TPA: cytochrome c3 family protein [Planctomycetota bacterium]
MAEGRTTGAFVLVTLAFGSITLVATADIRLPGNHRGYAPEQPIAFSHRQHAGELKIDCQYCHYAASKSPNAGIPPTGLCMNCHAHVSAGFDAVLEEREAAEAEGRDPRRIVSPEIAKLYAALGLDDDLDPVPGAEPRPVEWIRVHDLADFVYFDHRPHMATGVACQTCHGPVQGMERIRQETALSMGWCLDCHRKSPAFRPGEPLPDLTAPLRYRHHVSTDCATCHF